MGLTGFANLTNLTAGFSSLAERCIRIAFMDKENDILQPLIPNMHSGTCIRDDNGRLDPYAESVVAATESFIPIPDGAQIIIDATQFVVQGGGALPYNAYYSAQNEGSFLNNFSYAAGTVNVLTPPAGAKYFRMTVLVASITPTQLVRAYAV